MLFIGAQGDRRLVIRPRWLGIGRRNRSSTPDRSAAAKLDVTRAGSPHEPPWLCIPHVSDQGCGDGARGASAKDAGFRRALSPPITEGIHIGEAGFERPGLDRHIPVLVIARVLKDFGARWAGTPRKRSYGNSRPSSMVATRRRVSIDFTSGRRQK